MSASSGITVDAWLTELAKLGKKSAEGFTTEEVAEQQGRSVTWVGARMRKAFRAGLVEMAGTREDIRRDGKPYWIPVYRVTPAWGSKKKGGKGGRA